MNCSNILSVICPYLDLKSLLEFSRVSKAYHKASGGSEIWKVHFHQAFFGDLSIFGYFKNREIINGAYSTTNEDAPNFYALISQRGKILQQWANISTDHIQPQDLQDLRRELFLSLKEPILPQPILRREFNFFPSILQDLIGNAFVPPGDFEFFVQSPAFESLKNSINDLQMQFMDSDQIQELTHYRWILKSSKKEIFLCTRNSLGSRSTSAETEKSQSVLLNLMKTVKKTIKVHCLAVGGFLQGLGETMSFLTGYCMLVFFM